MNIKEAAERKNAKQITTAFSTNQEAGEFLNSHLADGDVVLLKASDGMKFKEIVEMLKRFV